MSAFDVGTKGSDRAMWPRPKAGLLWIATVRICIYVLYVSMLHGSVPLEYVVANHLPPPGPLNIHSPDSDSNSPQTVPSLNLSASAEVVASFETLVLKDFEGIMQMKNADFLHCARILELQIILLALRGCWLESSWSGLGVLPNRCACQMSLKNFNIV